jgi:hypothetical protein
MQSVAVWFAAVMMFGLADAETVQFKADFRTDAGWEGVNNSPAGPHGVERRQDFGYSSTGRAGGVSKGEIGGWVNRSVEPAWYAKVIEPASLQNRLTASGTMSVSDCNGGSGVLVGWFNQNSRGWRTPNSLVFRIDGEAGKYRVFFEYGTQQWRTGGGQTFDGPYQTTKTPLMIADGTPHRWTLTYDPDGANGDGEIALEVDATRYTAALDPGHKLDGAVFDRFGIVNVQIGGDGMSLYLDDVNVNGEMEDFASDPKWEGQGNRGTFPERFVRPIHDFKFQNTANAGGAPGEIGGVVWRIESITPQHAFHYGTPVGHLTLRNTLEASGKVALTKASADSAVVIGWYNSRTFIGAPPANFMGILVEGPSRAGHYVRPTFCTSDDRRAILDEGPVIRPDGKSHEWMIRYTPGASDMPGAVSVTLDGQEVHLDVPREAKKGNALFDRFGVLSWHRGGQFVEIYFDDLTYTAERNGRN